jgi:hypothetical protein
MPRSVQPVNLTSPAMSKTGPTLLPCTSSTHVRESCDHTDQACRMPSTRLTGRDLVMVSHNTVFGMGFRVPPGLQLEPQL